MFPVISAISLVGCFRLLEQMPSLGSQKDSVSNVTEIKISIEMESAPSLLNPELGSN
ncbi:MAG: hypothetical protein R2850_01150 [Bacteroidia bacterium]